MAVVHTDDDFGRYSAKALKDISKANGICIDSIQMIQVSQILWHSRFYQRSHILKLMF